MKFEVIRSGKQWYFRAVAGNGKVLCHSETYTRKRNALDAVKAIRTRAASAEIVESEEV